MMKKVTIKIFLLCSCICVFSILHSMRAAADDTHATELDKNTASELFNQATRFFKEANSKSIPKEEAISLYKKAALRYERLINEFGIENGKIYYNLGNIYFRTNDIGRAILNYLRAEQYMPNDPNLKQNLRYVREKRIDKIEGDQGTKILKTLFLWHYNLPVKTRVMLFSLFFVSIWIIAGFRIFFKKPFFRWCIPVSVFISLLMAGSLAVDELTLKTIKPGVVISPETTARKGNSETYEPSFTDSVHAGTEFVLMEDRGSWYYVKLTDSRTCWIFSRDAELIRQNSSKKIRF